MWKCFQIRTLYLKKATRSQYTGGIFDEVGKEKQPEYDYSSFLQMQELDGIE